MTLYLGLLSGVSAILYKNENDLPNIRAKVKLDYPTKALLSQGYSHQKMMRINEVIKSHSSLVIVCMLS